MRGHLYRLILVVCLVLPGFIPVWGQSYFFSTLSTRDGLPANIISSITQDQHDFLWVGTENGLARFDGYRFKTFKKEGFTNSIPSNGITSLLVDGNFLWVGTWQGLCKINTRTFEITQIDVRGNNIIRTLYRDKANIIWVGTSNGLLKFNQNQGDFIRFTTENANLSHNTIRNIHEDEAGNLWVGTYDRLNKLKKGTNQFENFDLKGDYNPSLKNNLICDIKPVAGLDSLLWVGTETGLCQINIFSGEFDRFSRSNTKLSNEVVKSIYTSEEGELWLGTDFGLNLFKQDTKEIVSYFHNPQINHSIANNVIWQIFEDTGGVIWLVTSNGLSKANKYSNLFEYQEISHHMGNQVVGNQVRSILISKKGTTWIATIHGVLSIDPRGNQKVYDIESGPSERLLLNNVFALEEDDLGRIWIGTAGGINVWDDQRQQMFSITANTENGLTSNYIAKFTKGADGSFWVSAWEGGLFKIVSGFNDLSSLKFEFVGDFGSQKNTYALNALWSISNNELYRIDLASYVTRKIETFNTVAKGRDVHNLYYSPKGSLWAGTLNGLLEYKANLDSAVFHPIITGSDIDLNNIMSDEYGNLWASSDRFILKFSPVTHRTEIFPLDKELPLKTFYTNCSAKSPEGDLLFGGDNGYIRFSQHIKPNNYQPNLYITSLEVNNKSIIPINDAGEQSILQEDIAFTETLILPYRQRSVTFEFSSLHFWQPEINVYAYMLEGFDQDWKYVSGSKNFAIYSNLPARAYTFKVKGTNNYGIWSDRITTTRLTISPPLFLSTGFLIVYAILILAAIIAALKIYTVRLKLKNDLKIALIEKEHAEEIVLTKQQFFTSISHELRTPISLIIPPIQQIIRRGKIDEEDKTLIILAEKNSQRLLRLINQILDYRKLEHENQSLTISWFDLVPFCQELNSLFSDKATRNEIDFRFEASMKECPIWADKEKVEIIIFNLLSNAFKFTPRKGRIEFTIDEDHSASFPDGAVKLSVSDNGIGISESDQKKIFDQFYQTEDAKQIEDGSGIGLTLVSEYTKIHRGKISLDSKKGTGSNFSVFLPLGNSHFPVDKSHEGKEITIVATKPVEALEQRYEFNLRSEKPLVLLVDDNGDIIEFITVALKHKYNFVSADNGEDGLQKSMNILPDVIVTDIMMPVMDGLVFCQKIKHDSRTSHIPIILLTAKSLTAQKVEGIRMGADTYITKPFEVELLEAHIDHLLERKAELAQYLKHELITQPKEVHGKENEDDKFLKKVMNAIEANISNPDFSVELLSREMGMSSTHLYRKLKSLTHLSANEIIKKYRIKKASLLLRNKEGNISEIMYEVGFSNLSYFSKCFKIEFGITPKEYQQKESKHTFDIQQKLESKFPL